MHRTILTATRRLEVPVCDIPAAIERTLLRQVHRNLQRFVLSADSSAVFTLPSADPLHSVYQLGGYGWQL